MIPTSHFSNIGKLKLKIILKYLLTVVYNNAKAKGSKTAI